MAAVLGGHPAVFTRQDSGEHPEFRAGAVLMASLVECGPDGRAIADLIDYDAALTRARVTIRPTTRASCEIFSQSRAGAARRIHASAPRCGWR